MTSTNPIMAAYDRGAQRRKRNRLLLNALVFAVWFAAIVTFPMWGGMWR